MRISAVLFSTIIYAGTAPWAGAAELPNGDQAFLATAADLGRLEVEGGELATRKAHHPEVRQYAEKMVADHRAMGTELEKLAAGKQFSLSEEAAASSKEHLDDLKDVAGREFDVAYVDNVAIDAHEDAVQAFERAAQDAEDADVKAFASSALPTLQAHLEQGRTLRDRIQSTEDARERDVGALDGDTPAERTEPPDPAKRY